jgi:hypothetical protein
VGKCTQSCCDVEGGTSEGTVLELDRLAGVDPDSDAQREICVRVCVVGKLALEIDGGSDCLTRGVEDGQGLVSTDLDQHPAANLHPVADEAAEPRRQPGGGLVAVLLGEAGVPADVCDEEGADGCVRRDRQTASQFTPYKILPQTAGLKRAWRA